MILWFLSLEIVTGTSMPCLLCCRQFLFVLALNLHNVCNDVSNVKSVQFTFIYEKRKSYCPKKVQPGGSCLPLFCGWALSPFVGWGSYYGLNTASAASEEVDVGSER